MTNLNASKYAAFCLMQDAVMSAERLTMSKIQLRLVFTTDEQTLKKSKKNTGTLVGKRTNDMIRKFLEEQTPKANMQRKNSVIHCEQKNPCYNTTEYHFVLTRFGKFINNGKYQCECENTEPQAQEVCGMELHSGKPSAGPYLN